MTVGRRIASGIVIGTLLLTMPFAALAKNPVKTDFDYVALGDSLAAGKTPYGELSNGYADYLVERFAQSQYEIELNNYGVSGYETSEILSELYGPSNEKYNALRESINEAELVTIDIGANDLLKQLQDIQTRTTAPQAVLSQIGINLHAILSEIDRINPETQVYVMGYYNPFPHLPEEQQAALMPLLDGLNDVIQSAALANGDVFVPTADVIKKNEKEFLPNPKDIHLSLEGYQAIAKEFWKTYLKTRK